MPASHNGWCPRKVGAVGHRTLSLLVVALFALCACGEGHSDEGVTPRHSLPPTLSQQADPPTRPIQPSQLCDSGRGFSFRDTAAARASGARSPQLAAAPWLLAGEALRAAEGSHGRRLFAYQHQGDVRQVVTVERVQPSGLWLILRNTACLTHRSPSGPACGDIVSFRGTTYRRPISKGPGTTEQIGVGRAFGQGSLPACADISQYAGEGEHLVGPLAPVTVYQQEEARASDIVVTSPLPEARLYESTALQSSAAPDTSVPPCRADRTRLAVVLTGSTMSQPFADIAITNTGLASCGLRGYPQIQAWGHEGVTETIRSRRLGILVHHGIYERADRGARRLIVQPGRAAFFSVGTGAAYQGGLHPIIINRLCVTLPGTRSAQSLSVKLLATRPPGRRVPVGITAVRAVQK